MFTGLIETRGSVTAVQAVSGGVRLQVYAPDFGRDMAMGDSICVDGVSLTVSQFQRGAFVADVSGDMLDRTTLSDLRSGSTVNLERALRFSDRMGGHMVTGHVDGVGRLVMRQAAGNSTIYTFHMPPALMEYIVPRGSLAVDGISLAVAQVRGEGFSAAVIPQTEESTTLRDKPIDSMVNIEVDIMARYVKRFVDLYARTGAEGPETTRRGLGDALREFREGR
ncbi:MAG: riboflavin synthase [Coriobacteriia bacterium]|nr:riboflavin synthase [Coriobacteriia bacterium]